MNNCKGCRYYSEYNDGKFTPLPVCSKHSNLISAAEAVKNSANCKENVNNKASNIDAFNETIKNATASFKDLANTTKEITTALESLVFKTLLKRWHNLLCESGTNTKTQVRKEISKVLTKLEQGEALNEIQ